MSNFCIQPWIHVASLNDGSVPLCCVAVPEANLNLNTHTIKQIWNSENYKSVRRDFLADKKPAQCFHCWKDESGGVRSHRIIENEYWERKLGKEFLDDLINSTHSDGTLNSDPITLDLRLGNTCNLQCVMCRPHDSSRWLSDGKKLIELLTTEVKTDWQHKIQIDTNKFDWFERTQTIESLNEIISGVKHIIFGGGEPLLIKQHLNFITNLVNSGHSQEIELRYHTNGTVLSEQIIELWSKFKHVDLMISLDDWAERASWIRYPSDWATIISNLHRLDSTPDNIDVRILTSVHAMNIYNLPDFATNLLAERFKKIGRTDSNGLFSVGTVHWPRYMSTQVLPQDVKQRITEYWNTFTELECNERWATRIRNQLTFMNSYDHSELFSEFVDYIDGLNEIRTVKFYDVYKEYWTVLGL